MELERLAEVVVCLSALHCEGELTRLLRWRVILGELLIQQVAYVDVVVLGLKA